MDMFSDWQQPLLWASAFSALAVIATIIGVPWLVTRLPGDYFARPKRVAWRQSSAEPVIAIIMGLLKNLLGGLLILLGLIMLVMPGQGILTILAGLLLVNFPGKYRLERWLVLRPGVLRGLNWLRRRQGHPPFEAPQQQSEVD
jgi:hypothetical protein